MADDPSNAELARSIERLTVQVSNLVAQFDRYLLSAVYAADERRRETVEAAQAERIRQLEEDRKAERKQADADRSANRRGNRASAIAALVAVAVAVATVIADKFG